MDQLCNAKIIIIIKYYYASHYYTERTTLLKDLKFWYRSENNFVEPSR